MAEWDENGIIETDGGTEFGPDGVVERDTDGAVPISAEASDGFAVSETLAKIATFQGVSADGFAGGDAGDKVTQFATVSVDGAVLSDSVTVRMDLSGVVVDGLTLAEALYAAAALLSTATDGLTLGEILSGTVGGVILSGTVTEGINIGDLPSATTTFTVTASDQTSFSESVSAIAQLIGVAVDGLTVSDVAWHIELDGSLVVNFQSKKRTITFIIKKP